MNNYPMPFIDNILDDITKLKEQKSILSSQIFNLHTRVQKLESHTPAQDTSAEIRTADAQIASVSTENPQESSKYAQPSLKCCGNCARFSNESVSGLGWCLDCEDEKPCSDCCGNWQHRPLREGEAVMWKHNGQHAPEAWKLGYYCAKLPFGHSIRDRRDGGTVHNVNYVTPFDTFDPYAR